MQIIWGPKAPSPLAGLKARYIHFIDSDDSSPEATEKLERLLDYGEAFVGEASNDYVIAIPRIGTISPWSSKATDIAHNAGLSFVKRIERGVLYFSEDGSAINDTVSLYDRMTEQIITSVNEAEGLFAAHEPAPLDTIPIMSEGKAAIAKINSERGLVLSEDEIEYLFNRFQELERDPTDVELMMFAQANNDHTRHKIFNAKWIVDGQEQADSLFGMIINTYNQNHEGIKSAYSDNGAVLAGGKAKRFYPDSETHEYIEKVENADIVIKAETHNHPTAISPFPGSGTGSGGEIRDEGATGRGAKPKAGLTGFSVSNLRIPGHERPWEQDYGMPARIVDALSIMTEGPLGAAAFNNEFGRTALAGYFRTFELEVNGQVRGYHKPIMLGGGLANIRPKDVIKQTIPVGAKIITLGGPAMLIGLGGGAASTVASGQQSEDLDFASVQRQNPEMQRRAQEVVNACWAAKDNPILSVHDVGAGGWSNALPELVKDAGRGARLELRELPNDEPGMSPMEIWSNEAQERYVLAIEEKDLERFKAICERERCPYAVLGEAVSEKHFQLSDSHFDNNAIDIPMDVVFGKPPKLEMKAAHENPKNLAKLDLSKAKLDEAVELVLRLPAVGSKSFLITIGDRTVGGMNVRDQMVGPWQVPVADSAVTVNDYEGYVGEAMAMGERTPLALINAPASGRMAIGEMITNIASAPIDKLSDVKLSANWMAAAGENDENLALFETVKTVGMEFCPALGLTIPVGKDSLSMKTIWEENGQQKSVVAPLSLVISGFAPVDDVRRSLTPQLKPDVSGTSLLLIDLSGGSQRLGGSALAYVYGQLGDESPDADAKLLNEFFSSIQSLSRDGKILAYHDRSDGGLFTTLAEMAFAGHCGLDIELPDQDPLPVLFNEELGAVIQVRDEDVALVEKSFSSVIRLGKCIEGNQIKITGQGWSLERSRTELQRAWSETSFLIQSRRDNPKLAQQEYDSLLDEDNPGLNASLSFKPQPTRRSVAIGRPKVAILREQGVNGQVEMAAAFTQVGFQAVDVHMTDLVSGKFKLEEFKGLVTCGGFSYGDVLGAGRGWAQTILFNEELKNQFKDFFERPDSFSLGVCNGCQMLSQLKELIPGAEAWPTFLTNASGRFESRLVMAEITDSPSIFFQGMAGSRLPMPVAHGEGRASFAKAEDLSESISCLRYVDNYGQPAEQYPANPNGSPQGLTGFTTPDGRATIMMPHPERSFRSIQMSWSPSDWSEHSPWLTMFANSFEWQAKH